MFPALFDLMLIVLFIFSFFFFFSFLSAFNNVFFSSSASLFAGERWRGQNFESYTSRAFN